MGCAGGVGAIKDLVDEVVSDDEPPSLAFSVSGLVMRGGRDPLRLRVRSGKASPVNNPPALVFLSPHADVTVISGSKLAFICSISDLILFCCFSKSFSFLLSCCSSMLLTVLARFISSVYIGFTTLRRTDGGNCIVGSVPCFAFTDRDDMSSGITISSYGVCGFCIESHSIVCKHCLYERI